LQRPINDFQNIFAKISAKKLAFFTQITAIDIGSKTLLHVFFKKYADFFVRKRVKFAENMYLVGR
jgi:hypothetical protein